MNRVAAAIDRQAHGDTEGTLQDWRAIHEAAFQTINDFHEAARDDLGVNGSFSRNRAPVTGSAPAPGRSDNES